MRTRTLIVAALACLALAAYAQAGVLASHPNAWTDPGGTTWCGTTALDSGSGLKADVDWCVFASGKYPFSGYTPTAGEFTYAYQVIVDPASVDIRKFAVGMLTSNEANNIGDDPSLAGHAPDSALFTGTPPNLDTAKWEWDETDPLLTSSDALVYSSINGPLMWVGTIQNGGQTVSGLMASPSDVIPEPATVGLMVAGGLGLLAARRRR